MTKWAKAAAVEIARRHYGIQFADSVAQEPTDERTALAEIIDRHHDPVPELFRMTVAALEIAIAERNAAREALILIRDTKCTAGLCLKTAVEGLAASHRAIPTASLGASEAEKGVRTAENACGEAGEGA